MTDQPVADVIREVLARGGGYQKVAAAIQPHLDELRDLVDELRDPDPCHYDHHGYCQAHWWFYTDPVCPHARAAALFPDTPEGDQP